MTDAFLREYKYLLMMIFFIVLGFFIGPEAGIFTAFSNMYKLTGDRLYLEKAMTLADKITRAQNAETGQIPTFLMGENCVYGYENFWINCQLFTANAMMKLAEITKNAK